MPADKVALSQAIKVAMDMAMEASRDSGANMETVRTNFANAIADAVDTYVKTITITIQTGVIQVQGSATNQANITPIEILNGIS